MSTAGPGDVGDPGTSPEAHEAPTAGPAGALRAPTRGERALALAGAAVGCVALGLALARPAGLLAPGTATDLAYRRSPPPSLPWPSRESASGVDAWGGPWRSLEAQTRFTIVYSAGPDGRDDRGAGDDVLRGTGLPDPWLTVVERPFLTLLPWAGLLLWLGTAHRIAGAPSAVGLGRELARGAWLLALPASLAGAAVGWTLTELGAGRLDVPLLLVPVPVAGGGTAALGVVLAGVWRRARRAHDGSSRRAEPPPAAVRWLAGGLVLAAAAGALGWAATSARRARRANNEGVAIQALRVLRSAQPRFRAAHPEHRYGTLAELGAAGLIDAALAEGARDGYRFTVHRSPERPRFVWTATAAPLEPGVTGERHFAVGVGGSLHANDEPFEVGDDYRIHGGITIGE